MNFSIIIPSKDRRSILEQTLKQVSEATNISNLEVIVINDSSQDLILDSAFHFVKIYKNNGYHGVASARNLGASKASHGWMIFMDDDMWVQPDTFEKLLPFTGNENHILNANWIYPEFLAEQLPYKPFLRYLRRFGFDSLEGWCSDIEWKTNEVFQVNGITSQFLLISKKAFNKVGGYNVSFPFAGFEDHDMSKRLKLNGIPVFIDPRNKIFHNEADRLDLENWLERKKRGAITRRVGASIGYHEVALQYSLLKKIIYSSVYVLRAPLLNLLKKWNYNKRIDSLYFLLVNILLGTYSYIGYTSKQAKDFVNAKN